MTNGQLIPVFVISLARAPSRRLAITQHLSELNVKYRLIDAVDGEAMSENDINAIVAKNIKLPRGAVGCYLSHIQAYKIMEQENIPVALVLEDDARLNPNIVKLLTEGLLFSNWDYCFLDCMDFNRNGPVFYDADSGQNLGAGFIAYELSGGPKALHAYMITLEAAKKRLEIAYPLVKPIDIYDHLPYPIKFYAIVSPKAAWVSEHSLESYITLGKQSGTKQLSFISLRQSPIFYYLRDLINLKYIKRKLLIKNLQKKGNLNPNKRWKPLQGRVVLTH
ncbi:MAG: glycosyltransferase family 25 protein [Gammaproteobacteria bacterium]|nr:glycosyltransferase family 25 protein [Gammaproteobacteria bacterium]